MAEATLAIDLSLLEGLLAKYSKHSRPALLPMLHEAQALYGWLPRPVLEAIGRTLRVPFGHTRRGRVLHHVLHAANVATGDSLVRGLGLHAGRRPRGGAGRS